MGFHNADLPDLVQRQQRKPFGQRNQTLSCISPGSTVSGGSPRKSSSFPGDRGTGEFFQKGNWLRRQSAANQSPVRFPAKQGKNREFQRNLPDSGSRTRYKERSYWYFWSNCLRTGTGRLPDGTENSITGTRILLAEQESRVMSPVVLSERPPSCAMREGNEKLCACPQRCGAPPQIAKFLHRMEFVGGTG